MSLLGAFVIWLLVVDCWLSVLGSLVCGGWAAYFFVNCWYLSFSVWVWWGLLRFGWVAGRCLVVCGFNAVVELVVLRLVFSFILILFCCLLF